MDGLKNYYYPSSLKEALSLITDESTGIIAGGTHINSSKSQSITNLVDIMHIGLSYIQEKNNTIHVGSTTTISEMFQSSLVKKIGNGTLTKACRLIGDTPLRNMITLGGNIAKPYPWAGLPVVLLSLEAEIEIIGQGESSKVVSAEEFFERQNLAQGEIIKEIIFPIKKDWFCRYEKFALTTVDFTWLTMAFATKVENSSILEPHLAVSRIVKPRRINEVEKFLTGKKINLLDLAEASSILRNSIKIVPDYRTPVKYRKHLLGIIFKRMLKELKEEEV